MSSEELGGCQRKIEAAEEEIRDGEIDDEYCRRVTNLTNQSHINISNKVATTFHKILSIAVTPFPYSFNTLVHC